MGGKLGTKEESEKIIELYNQGLTNMQIAKLMLRSEYFVRTRVEAYKLNKEIYCPGLPNEEELTNQIIELYKEGYSIRKISDLVCKSFSYVYSRINKYREDNFVTYDRNWGE